MTREPRRQRGPGRLVADDGLDEVVQFDQDTPPEVLGELLRDGFGGFEWLVRGSEASMAEADARCSIPRGKRRPLTLEYSAAYILPNIARLRRAIARDKTRERDIVLALQTGSEIANATWRANRGAWTRIGKRRREELQKSGRQSGRTRAKKRDDVLKEAREVRAKTPHSRKHSTRWLATLVAGKLKKKFGTVREALRTNRIK
jgi:hypothetical protein